MAGGFRNRKRKPPVRLIGAGVVAVMLVGGVFYLASKAESNPPPLQEIRAEAVNVTLR